MKDYNRLIIWVDYFNSTLSRKQGRRVPLNQAVRNPTLKELEEAAKRIGYHPESVIAAHPKRNYMQSGYISIEKLKPKSKVISEIAKALTIIRGEMRQKTESN
ncbi:MAG: signal recognition particle subunit SRP19/SEC65 family protein [Nitrososphaerales archaeon]